MTTTAPVEEKRQFPRVTCEGQVFLRTEERFEPIACTPQNVSIGGVCVRLEAMLEIGAEVDVQLVLPQFAQPLACHGRVCWTTARMDLCDEPPIPYDVGIEFLNVSIPLRETLRRLVAVLRGEAPPSR